MKLIRTRGRSAAETAKTLAALERRGSAALDAVLPAVRRIVADVRRRGDRGLLRYASQFDGLPGVEALRVTPLEMEVAWKAVDSELRAALSTAAKQIRRFAERQMPTSWNASPLAGLTTGQLVRPLGSVGCYVPSGRHPLPSTLLMTAIPAQVAGVKRIVCISPKPAPETLAAARLLGITEFYRLGGAHAVAALAYGTESVARVDKIWGRGISTSPRPSVLSLSTAPSTCWPGQRRLLLPANAVRPPASHPISSRRRNTILRRWLSSSQLVRTWRKK